MQHVGRKQIGVTDVIGFGVSCQLDLQMLSLSIFVFLPHIVFQKSSSLISKHYELMRRRHRVDQLRDVNSATNTKNKPLPF
jgi:hypothetical protein